MRNHPRALHASSRAPIRRACVLALRVAKRAGINPVYVVLIGGCFLLSPPKLHTPNRRHHMRFAAIPLALLLAAGVTDAAVWDAYNYAPSGRTIGPVSVFGTSGS